MDPHKNFEKPHVSDEAPAAAAPSLRVGWASGKTLWLLGSEEQFEGPLREILMHRIVVFCG